MDPEHGATGITCRPRRGCPGGGVAVAQLTVPTGDPCEGAVSAQGRSVSGADWDVRELRFSGATAPPPPPAPAPPPAAPTRTPTPCPDDPDLVMWDMVLSLCAPIDVAAAPQGAMSSSSGNRRDLETTHPGITRGDHAGRAQVESSQARTENDSCHPPRLQRSSGPYTQFIGTLEHTSRWAKIQVVKYSGWTPDGNMFDSSFRHSRDGSGTMSFRLNQVISGW